MKRLHRFGLSLFISIAFALPVVLPVLAADAPLVVPPALTQEGAYVSQQISPIIITEIQTGNQSASDEFIELFNRSTTAVDMTGWHIRFMNSTASSTTRAAVIGALVLPAGEHLVLHTPSMPVSTGIRTQVYDAGLSSTDKAVGLYAPNTALCKLEVQDAIGWGSSIYGEGVSAAGVPTGHVYASRYVDGAGIYVDTDSNLFDIQTMQAAASTPGVLNDRVLPPTLVPQTPGGASRMPALTIQGCAKPQPSSKPKEAAVPPVAAPAIPAAPQAPPASLESATSSIDGAAAASKGKAEPRMPARNAGLFAPQISELLPNPAKPQTDADNEFIELYNPNAAPFELSGFRLEVGTKTKKRFSFAVGTVLEPKTFRAYFSKDTNLTLANASGQVRLLDPFDRVIAESAVYTDAKDGQAWLFAASKWQWTLTPTPGALNSIRAPTAKGPGASPKQSTVAATSATQQGEAGSKSSEANGGTADKSADSFNPLHPGILAATGVVAVLYGLYEYRSDMGNKLQQLRANRAARRAARESVQGWGGHRADK